MLWKRRYRRWFGGLCVCVLSSSIQALSLPQAEKMLLAHDAASRSWLAEAEAQRELSIAAASLPDPQLFVAANNLPVDTLDWQQEPMTQLKVGLRQQFPAGDSLPIQSASHRRLSKTYQQRALWQRLQVLLHLRKDWLSMVQAQQQLQVLQSFRPQFVQLQAVTHALYEVGRKDQQAVFAVELALSQLDEQRLQKLTQIDLLQGRLHQHVGNFSISALEWPEWPKPLVNRQQQSHQFLMQQLHEHPQVAWWTGQVEQAELQVALAEQAFKPAWAVDVSYGHRQGQNQNGRERADLFSAQLSVNLPLWSERRQAPQQRAARQRQMASEQQRLDHLRHLASDWHAADARYWRLQQRLVLYRQRLLKQSEQQVEAAMAAYQTETASFADVMRAVNTDLQQQLAYWQTLGDSYQALAQLRYWQWQQDQPLLADIQTDVGRYGEGH